MGEFEQQASWGFETAAIHAGQAPDPVTGAVVTPISLSTTFQQPEVGQHRGYEYSRSGNPTRTAYETQVAALEGATHGLAFSSGLAAEDNVLRLLAAGDRVLLGNDAYGGTYRLISKVHTQLPWTAVDLLDIDGTRPPTGPPTRS
jgi:cystathionine gamma-synthase